jgi:hypothetical protein
VCQAITELAVEMNAPITAADFHTMNGCLDDAIAGAVTEYGRERDESTKDAAAALGSARVGFLAHELRNLVNTAIVAFEVLKTGNVGVSRSTGSVLYRSLLGLRSLVWQSLAEVRPTQEVQRQPPIQVSGFIEEIGAAATLEALAKGLRFAGLPVEDGVTIEGDRQILAAATAGGKWFAPNALSSHNLTGEGDSRVGPDRPSTGKNGRVEASLEDPVGPAAGRTRRSSLYRRVALSEPRPVGIHVDRI